MNNIHTKTQQLILNLGTATETTLGGNGYLSEGAIRPKMSKWGTMETSQLTTLGSTIEHTLGTSGRDFESIGRPRWW